MIALALVLVAVSTFAQVLQPAPPIDLNPGDPATPTTDAAPPTGSPRASSPALGPQAHAKLTVDDLPTPKAYGEYLYQATGFGLADAATKGTDFVNDVWSLPDFLTFSRSADNTVDQPDAAQLNDGLVKLIGGLMIVGMVLVLGLQAFSVLRGEMPNPMLAFGALTIVSLAALAAVNNRELQHFPIDLVNLILSTISGAPIKDFIGPVFHLAAGADAFWGALFLLVLIVVVLGLTVVLFIEGAWCLTLGALLGLAAFGVVLPIFGGGCRFLLARWMGSLFSPMIVFAALRLATPSISKLDSLGVNTVGVQMLALALLFVAWQAPGMMVGAISVSFPNIGSMYMLGRLTGAGRISERFVRRDGGSGVSRGGESPSIRMSSPHSAAGRRPGRVGNGSAASGRMYATA